jgi:hypothetical protein
MFQPLPRSQGVLAHGRVCRLFAPGAGSFAMSVGPKGCGFAPIVGPHMPVFASPRSTVLKPLQLLGSKQFLQHYRWPWLFCLFLSLTLFRELIQSVGDKTLGETGNESPHEQLCIVKGVVRPKVPVSDGCCTGGFGHRHLGE